MWYQHEGATPYYGKSRPPTSQLNLWTAVDWFVFSYHRPMVRARVFEWFRRFKEGLQSVNSDPRSGRPSTSRNEDKIAQVKAEVRSDRRLTVRGIAQECHIFVGSFDEILRKDLNMRPVSAKFVPSLLTEDQQFQRLATSLSQDQEHLKRTPVSGH
ncbi:protein GVQW3 [Trichonephila clavipes]|nr:protein GVQW3 [Trichonephila clavipes]